MNETMKAALVEAYATAPSNVVILNTLEIRHPMLPGGIFRVCNPVSITARLEVVPPATEGVLQVFTAAAFEMAMPSVDDSGLQQTSITLDDIDGLVMDFLTAAKAYRTPVQVIIRPYLSNDLLSGPQLDPPLYLSLGTAVAQNGTVTMPASFVDLINAKFLTELYTSARFRSLGTL